MAQGVVRVCGFDANDVVNGEGISVSIFFSGCPFHCKGCHNPESWNPDYGKNYWITSVIDIVENAIQLNDIDRNLSILGGEPLWRDNDNDFNTAALVMNVKKDCPNTKIFLWTGYLFEDLLEDDFIKNSVLPYIDVLIDGQYVEEERDITLKLRGSRNQRVIDVQKSLKDKKVCLYEPGDKALN